MQSWALFDSECPSGTYTVQPHVECPMFLNPATMPIVATFHTLPAPYIAIFVPSTLPTLPVALPVALPTLPSETFSEKTCITSCYRDVKCAVIILSISTYHAECFL